MIRKQPGRWVTNDDGVGGVRQKIWTDKDVIEAAVGPEVLFASQLGGEGAGERCARGPESSRQIDITGVEDRGDAAVIDLAGVQVPRTGVLLVQHGEEWHEFGVGLVMGLVGGGEPVEIADHDDARVGLGQGGNILDQVSGFLDPARVVAGMEVNDIEMNSANPAAQQTVMHPIADAVHFGDRGA